MTNRVVHFEIPYDDEARARSFYEQAFGWDIALIPGFEGYPMVSTGPTDPVKGASEPGFINGGMMQRNETFAAPNLVLDTDSIETSLKAVETAGGEVVQSRQAVGDMGFAAYFRDSEGNLVGLWQSA